MQDKTQLQFYLFSQKDQLLQQFVQKHDLFEGSNAKLFNYQFVVPISKLQTLQAIKKATKSVSVSLLYRRKHHQYSWYLTSCKKELATHILVIVRKKQLSRDLRQQYIANKKYHYEQYMLYKDKLLSRTV